MSMQDGFYQQTLAELRFQISFQVACDKAVANVLKFKFKQVYLKTHIGVQ